MAKETYYTMTWESLRLPGAAWDLSVLEGKTSKVFGPMVLILWASEDRISQDLPRKREFIASFLRCMPRTEVMYGAHALITENMTGVIGHIHRTLTD